MQNTQTNRIKSNKNKRQKKMRMNALEKKTYAKSRRQRTELSSLWLSSASCCSAWVFNSVTESKCDLLRVLSCIYTNIHIMSNIYHHSFHSLSKSIYGTVNKQTLIDLFVHLNWFFELIKCLIRSVNSSVLHCCSLQIYFFNGGFNFKFNLMR